MDFGRAVRGLSASGIALVSALSSDYTLPPSQTNKQCSMLGSGQDVSIA